MIQRVLQAVNFPNTSGDNIGKKASSFQIVFDAPGLCVINIASASSGDDQGLDTLIFAFKGTTTTANWMTNLQIAPATKFGNDTNAPYVHPGFAQEVEKFWPNVERLLEAHKATTRSVLFTGHSLGGAVCTLMWVRAKIWYRNQDFGDTRKPKVHLVAFAPGPPFMAVQPNGQDLGERLSALIPYDEDEKIISVVNGLDAVPRLMLTPDSSADSDHSEAVGDFALQHLAFNSKQSDRMWSVFMDQTYGDCVAVGHHMDWSHLALPVFQARRHRFEQLQCQNLNGTSWDGSTCQEEFENVVGPLVSPVTIRLLATVADLTADRSHFCDHWNPKVGQHQQAQVKTSKNK